MQNVCQTAGRCPSQVRKCLQDTALPENQFAEFGISRLRSKFIYHAQHLFRIQVFYANAECISLRYQAHQPSGAVPQVKADTDVEHDRQSSVYRLKQPNELDTLSQSDKHMLSDNSKYAHQLDVIQSGCVILLYHQLFLAWRNVRSD